MKKTFTLSIGDPVWLMHEDRAVCATVTGAWYAKHISCVDYTTIHENESYALSLAGRELRKDYKINQLFHTKEDLLNSL